VSIAPAATPEYSAAPMPVDPPPADPFDLLGLPHDFDLDPARLARAYLTLAARLHPDVARDDPGSAALAAAANKAKAILDDPERRANALLQRLGGPAKDADRALPDGFLMEILETREQIESAAASPDRAQIDHWRRWAADQRSRYIARASGLFRQHTAAPDSATLRVIRQELNAWRYIERLIEQLEPGYDPSETDLRDA
jgi:curved DNA-binding protein CbpA